MTTFDEAHEFTVPTALLALIHTTAGQPYQRFQPHRLIASAELAELIVRESISIVDDRIVPTGRPVTESTWQTDVEALLTRACGADGISVRSWFHKRRDAYDVHVAEADRAGVLTTSTKKFLGVVPYRRAQVAPAARAWFIALLTDPAAAHDPRASALAALVTKSDVISVLDLDDDQKAHIRSVADTASTTPVGKSLSSMTVALATVGYLTITG